MSSLLCCSPHSPLTDAARSSPRAAEGWNAGFHDEDDEEAVDTVRVACCTSLHAFKALADTLQQYQNTTEATLFLVEATETMLDTEQGAGLVARPGQASQSSLLNYKGRDGSTGGNASSKLELTLRAALAMMKRKVISCPKDLVGIIVFNTVSSRSRSYRRRRTLTLVRPRTGPVDGHHGALCSGV